MPSLLTDTRRAMLLTLDDGTIAHARPAAVKDLPLIDDLHSRCSTGSLTACYGGHLPGFTSMEWRRRADSPRHCVLLVTPAGSDGVVAMASMTESPDAPDTCEMKLLVADRSEASFQSRGLGTALAGLVADLARDTGFASLAVSLSWANWRMLLIVEHLGGPVLPQTSYVRNMAMLGLVPNRGLDVADAIDLRIVL
ncbi:GNAT family N-acetyltransferase [Streptomyces sp. 4F14]|uniref:GNAT family N-acetyltransferase n=1 Tax=Streptomyces sp. 4F14 TaxID=3394380 RepID=UPI003A88A54C